MLYPHTGSIYGLSFHMSVTAGSLGCELSGGEDLSGDDFAPDRSAPGWISSLSVGSEEAAHPPPSAFTSRALASIRRRQISTWLRSLSRYSVWAVMTWRELSRPPM